MVGRRPHSVFADQLCDAALQLAFFLLALAQPLLEIGDGEFGWGPPAERNTDKIVAPPDDFGEEGTAFLRDGQRYPPFGQLDGAVEFEAGALFGNVADDAVCGCATLVDFGNAAIDYLAARALASIQHRMSSPIIERDHTPLRQTRKTASRKMQR